MTPAPPAGPQAIRTYGPGRFVVGDREWREPILIVAAATTPWNVVRADELSADVLSHLPSIEVLVVGCGARSVFIPPVRRAAFREAGVGLEIVDTGAACRIYNVLLAEGRRVAAALIPL